MAIWQWFFGVGVGMAISALAFLLTKPIAQENKPRNRRHDYTDDDDICAICCESLNDRPQNTAYLKCLHRFHDKCISELRFHGVDRCPKCREII